MEPLRNLTLVKKWAKYKPCLYKYTSPATNDLLDTNVYELLSSTLKVLQPGGLISAALVSTWARPGLVINQVPFPMPLGDADFDAILGSGSSSRTKVEGVCEIDARDVQTSCTTWKASLDAGTKSILSRMKAKARYRSTLVSLTVVPPGEAHTLNLSSVSKSHFATLIAVLPSPRTGATFETRYREHKSHHNLSNLTPNSTHLLGLYTGMDSAVIKASSDRLCFLTYHVQCPPRTTSIPSIRNVAGPRTEIATAFASWAHALSTNTKAPGIPSNHIIYQLDGVYRNNVVATGLTNRKDRLVLAHLAPAAKHYGFKMVLAHADVHLTYSTTRVSTDDKEVEQVSAYVEDETEWEFCPLGRKEPCDDYAYHEVIDALKERGPCINYHAGYKSFDKNALETLGRCPTEAELMWKSRASFLIIGPPCHLIADTTHPVSLLTKHLTSASASSPCLPHTAQGRGVGDFGSTQ